MAILIQKHKANPKTKLADYDNVGKYDQNKVNGITPRLIESMIELIQPDTADSVLDAMAGNGNLTESFFAYCQSREITGPKITVLEYSPVQLAFAEANPKLKGADFIWGDVITMTDRKTGEAIPDESFDRIMIKSALHEIPLEEQQTFLESVFRVLRPGGLFVNLGFLFTKAEEREEFAEIAKVKDKLAGMEDAARRRHFSTEAEFFGNLKSAGFINVYNAQEFCYSIRSDAVAQNYFKGPHMKDYDRQHQDAQRQAKNMIQNQRIVFEDTHSVMICPGQVTLAQKPKADNRQTFRDYPQCFLSQVRVHSEMMQKAARELPAKSKLLDLGCGRGLLLPHVHNRCQSYLGLDYSEQLIKKCQDEFSDIDKALFQHQDISKAELEGLSYDAVTLLNILNLPGLKAVDLLRNAIKGLKKSGHIVVAGPRSKDSWAIIEPQVRAQLLADGALPKYQDDFDKVCQANGRLVTVHGNYWSLEGMMQLLELLGCRVVSGDQSLYYGQSFLVHAVKN